MRPCWRFIRHGREDMMVVDLVRLRPHILLSTNRLTDISFPQVSIHPTHLRGQPALPCLLYIKPNINPLSRHRTQRPTGQARPATRDQPPSPSSHPSGFHPSATVGYSLTGYIPLPPESSYRGAEVELEFLVDMVYIMHWPDELRVELGVR
jgi:hypothetical protein